MKLALALTCALLLALTGTLFAAGKVIPGESYTSYAGVVERATSCELGSCGCLGLKCSCFECGKK